MRNRRDLAIVAAALAGVVVLAIAVGPSPSSSADDPRPSTYLAGPHGTRALFLTLDELDVPMARHLEAWDQSPPEGEMLVVLAPSRLTPRAVDTLVDWVEGGGTLVYGSGMDDPLGEALGLQVRSAAPDTLSQLERVRWIALRGEGRRARPADPHPWTEGVAEVPGFHRAFSPESALLEREGARTLLFLEGEAPVLVLVPFGAGRIVAWSDPWVLSNGRLREGSAALVFARTAGEVRAEGPVRFDEYVHGFQAEGGPVLALRRFLTGTGAGRWVLQAGVAALALLLLAGHRLGAPRPSLVERRRSPLEHVEALSAAFRKADARKTARRLVLAGLDRRLGRPVTPAPGSRLRAELDRGERGDLVALAAATDEFIEEVRGWTRAK